jgi:hypothetical protein
VFKDILSYLWNRRTTVLGYMQIILGVIVVSEGLFSDQSLKWFVLCNGILTAVLGHYNNTRVPPTAFGNHPNQGGFARPLMLAFLLAIAAPTFLVLPACGVNPVETAQTLEQKSLAIYGEFVIIKEQAAKVFADPATPAPVRKALKEANDAATGPINILYQTALEYAEVKKLVAAGTTDEERLAIVMNNLADWYYRAKPLYEKFDAEVKKVTK